MTSLFGSWQNMQKDFVGSIKMRKSLDVGLQKALDKFICLVSAGHSLEIA